MYACIVVKGLFLRSSSVVIRPWSNFPSFPSLSILHVLATSPADSGREGAISVVNDGGDRNCDVRQGWMASANSGWKAHFRIVVNNYIEGGPLRQIVLVKEYGT